VHREGGGHQGGVAHLGPFILQEDLVGPDDGPRVFIETALLVLVVCSLPLKLGVKAGHLLVTRPAKRNTDTDATMQTAVRYKRVR
jgi:hypothetical protein